MEGREGGVQRERTLEELRRAEEACAEGVCVGGGQRGVAIGRMRGMSPRARLAPSAATGCT
eukprot:289999-Prymnesium_polylepis.1